MTIEHLREICQEIADGPKDQLSRNLLRISDANDAKRTLLNFRVLSEEIEKLKPEQFTPSFRAEFLRIRSECLNLHRKSSKTIADIRDLSSRVEKIFDHYVDNPKKLNLESVYKSLNQLSVELVDSVEQKSGLYGRVYKGRQTNIDRFVALKVMKNEWQHTADAIAHARILAKVDAHPNIVKVMDVGTVILEPDAEPIPAIMMEWLEGTSLGERLAGNKFSKDEALRLVKGITDGVEHMHSLDVAHQDINLGNVMVLPDCTPKIIDIDANRDNTLGRLSSISRAAAIQNDTSFCRENTMMILRKSGLDVSQLVELTSRLNACNSIAEIRAVGLAAFDIPSITEANSAELRLSSSSNVVDDNDSSYESVVDFIENNRALSLQKLVVAKTKTVCQELLAERFSCQANDLDAGLIRKRVADYDSLLEPLWSVMAPGAYWGTKDHQKHWRQVVESLANIYETQDMQLRGGKVVLLELRCYPPLVALYVAGFAAWLNEQFDTLFSLLRNTSFMDLGRRQPLPRKMYTWKAKHRDFWNDYVLDKSRLYVPISDHLLEIVTKTVEPLTSLNKNELSDAFDDFEYFCGLVEAYGSGEALDNRDATWGPVGRFIWKFGTHRSGEHKGEEFARRFGDPNWTALQSGFFSGKQSLFLKTISNFEHFCGKVRNQMGVF